MNLLNRTTLFAVLFSGFCSAGLMGQDQGGNTPTETAPSDAVTMKGHQGWFLGIRGAHVPALALEIGYEFNQTFKLRLFGMAGRYSKAFSADNQRYDPVRFKPQKIGFMADWHPWKNGFRLTAGAAYNRDHIRLTHAVTGTLLGLPATVYGTITANYRYRRWLAPYLGFGYDTGPIEGTNVSLSADAGFWIQGKVRSSVDLTGTGRNTVSVIDSTKSHVSYLLNKYKLNRNVPMVSVGVRYSFG